MHGEVDVCALTAACSSGRGRLGCQHAACAALRAQSVCSACLPRVARGHPRMRPLVRRHPQPKRRALTARAGRLDAPQPTSTARRAPWSCWIATPAWVERHAWLALSTDGWLGARACVGAGPGERATRVAACWEAARGSSCSGRHGRSAARRRPAAAPDAARAPSLPPPAYPSPTGTADSLVDSATGRLTTLGDVHLHDAPVPAPSALADPSRANTTAPAAEAGQASAGDAAGAESSAAARAPGRVHAGVRAVGGAAPPARCGAGGGVTRARLPVCNISGVGNQLEHLEKCLEASTPQGCSESVMALILLINQ